MNWEPHGASALLSGSRALAMFSSLWSRALGMFSSLWSRALAMFSSGLWLCSPQGSGYVLFRAPDPLWSSGLRVSSRTRPHSHRRLCTVEWLPESIFQSLASKKPQRIPQRCKRALISCKYVKPNVRPSVYIILISSRVGLSQWPRYAVNECGIHYNESMF